MLRQKPAPEEVIQKLALYLNTLRSRIRNNEFQQETPEQLRQAYNVAKRTFSDCKALKIIKVEKDTVTWLINKDFSERVYALKILEYRLKQSKKSIHVPIPELASLTDTLKTIAERLAHITVQYEKGLKRAENSFVDIEAKSDLFHVDEQRLIIAGAIASAVYKEEPTCEHIMASYPVQSVSLHPSGTGRTPIMPLANEQCIAKCIKCGFQPDLMKERSIDETINERNNFIVKATDDLINKLLKRDGNNEASLRVTQPVGRCEECHRYIHPNETFVENTEGNQSKFYCALHIPIEAHIKNSNS